MAIPYRRHLLNPYLQVLASSVLVAIAEIFLKKGADEGVAVYKHLSWLGFSSLGTSWVWIGIICYVASFLIWLWALRSLPLIIAFNLASIVHVLVPLGCWIFLGEKISLQRWLGIFLVLGGIWIIIKPLVKMEERL